MLATQLTAFWATPLTIPGAGYRLINRAENLLRRPLVNRSRRGLLAFHPYFGGLSDLVVDSDEGFKFPTACSYLALALSQPVNART